MKRLVVAALAVLLTTAAHAEWPEKPITMIVPYQPAGTTDLLAREAAKAISDAVGQPVVVENKPGAGGVLGTSLVAQAKKDGYTILFGNNATQVVQPLTNSAAKYDPLKDFTSIGSTADTSTFFGVLKSTNITTLEQFIDYAKAHPGLKYGTAGVGSIGQFTVEMFRLAAGIDVRHIPYDGSMAALTAMMSGETFFTMDPVVYGQGDPDKINILAVLADRRYPGLPDVPTARERGIDAGITGWFGVIAPAGIPEEARKRMSDALKAMSETPGYQERVKKMGLVPFFRDYADLDAQIETDLKVFADLRDKAGIPRR